MANDFILNRIPKFGDARVTIGKETYELHMVGDQGGVVTITEGGIVRDGVPMTKNMMKALWTLLNTAKATA